MSITINEEKFGENCKLFTIDNGKIKFSATNLGCTVTNLFVPDRDGKMTDVLLGYDTIDEWMKGTEAHNAVVGRVANRIADGKFTLDGKSYTLDVNCGPHCLHGGNNRFEKMIWNAEWNEAAKRLESVDDGTKVGICFKRISKAMEQGFPCDVEISVEYSVLPNDSAIFMEYHAKVLGEGGTPINLTNHAYFNLNGVKGTDGKIDNVLNHEMLLECSCILENNNVMIPTGKKLPVAGTEFDFTTQKSVGKDIGKIGESFGFGYDHCFVTNADENESKVVPFGSIFSPKTGISMDILTNQMGVQVYTGNYLTGVKGKDGVVHNKYDGICFETQRFPDCINQSAFPSCVLRAGEEYVSKTVYKFGIK